MERIFLSKLIAVLSLFFIYTAGYAQQKYYVFQKRGQPKLNFSKLLERGSLFMKSDTLFLGTNDYLLLVDESGELFEINHPNTYVFSAIKDFKRKLESNSVTKKYFSYVWKQFTNQSKKKQKAGIVYREGRKISLISPKDSVKQFSPEIQFSWQNTTGKSDVFFFLKDIETGQLSKIGLTGNTLLLNPDNILLKPGKDYAWSVSVSSFPNLNELKFNRLKILTKENHDKLETEIAHIVTALKLLDLSKAEIQEAICQDYKFCTY